MDFLKSFNNYSHNKKKKNFLLILNVLKIINYAVSKSFKFLNKIKREF